MRASILTVILIGLLAACGAEPEQVVIPTQAVVLEATPIPEQPDTIATLAPPPTEPPVPAALNATRDVIAHTDTGEQFVVISRGGVIDPPQDFNPGELYVIGAGNTPARITVSEAAAMDPVWSTDGNTIYFVSDADGTPRMYTVNANNTNPVQRIAPFDEGDQRQPSLSRDGLNFAFTSNRTGNDDIFRMSSDGRAVTQLTTDPAPDYDPSWSPDNAWITFVSERDGNPEIYMMDTNGETVHRLTDSPATDSQPAFSPDGRQIAFISDRTNGIPQVFLINLPEPIPAFGEGTYGVAVDLSDGFIPPFNLDTEALPVTPLQLTGDPAAKETPAWYVAGDEGGFRLTYAAMVRSTPEGDQWQAFRANGDGSNPTPLGDPLLSYTSPVYRPNP